MQGDNDIEQSIRDKYLVLTAGRYEIHRSSQVSQPSGDNGARYFAPADIESFHATEVQDTLRVLAKNACINIDIHLVSAANKLSLIKFDLMWFLETRCKDHDIFMDGKHILIFFNSNMARSPASGVAILIHGQWNSNIFKKTCVNQFPMSAGAEHLVPSSTDGGETLVERRSP